MRRRLLLPLLLSFVATVALGDWRRVADGIEYRRITRDALDVHIARIDLTNPALRVIATSEAERGMTVSEFAKKKDAIVAINADYFDKEMRPIGFAMGPCGVWGEPSSIRRQPIVAVGEGRAEILTHDATVEEWMSGAVSGWPMLVTACEPIENLPGSDFFTRAPHPRTAVGLSKDRRTLYFVVADGRREGVPGPTLPELAAFMATELDACTSLNLDGGGSSAMWLTDRVVNQPSDPVERTVVNHLAVIAADDYRGCERRTRGAKD